MNEQTNAMSSALVKELGHFTRFDQRHYRGQGAGVVQNVVATASALTLSEEQMSQCGFGVGTDPSSVTKAVHMLLKDALRPVVDQQMEIMADGDEDMKEEFKLQREVEELVYDNDPEDVVGTVMAMTRNFRRTVGIA